MISPGIELPIENAFSLCESSEGWRVPTSQGARQPCAVRAVGPRDLNGLDQHGPEPPAPLSNSRDATAGHPPVREQVRLPYATLEGAGTARANAHEGTLVITLAVDKACPASHPDPGSKPRLLAQALESDKSQRAPASTVPSREVSGSEAGAGVGLPEDRFHLKLPKGGEDAPSRRLGRWCCALPPGECSLLGSYGAVAAVSRLALYSCRYPGGQCYARSRRVEPVRHGDA